ncbi:MAG TPA: glycosyl hydrolase [Thermomicrobiales bacterium]|nr:glycosyl hydrolase [Thermomicrobiales bacterium]
MNASANPPAAVRDSVLAALEWRCIGPHRGGRVVAVSGDVTDPHTYYFGACAGGVWKTVDGGTTWRNVSDGYFTTAAVGAIAVSASDPNVVYAGTGETCIRNNVSHGDGVYKSTDGGKTWANVGLRDTRHIGKIRIHPQNPDLAYVAALGHTFGPSAERGVYRTRDGGKSWERVLYKSDRAGSHDLSMAPNNPRILYAAIWQTRRYPHTFVSGGPDSGLWKTNDGGDTWTEITRNPGLPAGVLGKIGVAVSPARTDRVWALVEAEDGGLFRSDDGGDTWERVSDAEFLRNRAWYYMHLIADPQDPETVWGLNYNVWKSVDGGRTFAQIPSQHGDEHDLWINPRDSNIMIKGDDGGACVTYTGGATWSTLYNQPTAQMYHVAADDRFPYRVYGSQQDNTAISVPSATVEGAIHERDWFEPGGGESGYIAVKPDDPDLVVASGPIGRRAFNDRMRLYDHRTGQRRDITVWPELYGWDRGAIDLKYRFQWTFPIFFSRHHPDELYVAGNRAFRSTDLGTSWEAISPDLTRNDPGTLQASGGPITRDNTGAEVYGTIFALAESPHEAGVFWAGSDDGLLHLSRDGGKTWQNITPPAGLLPEWALISIIEPSPHDPATAYVAATRYKHDDTGPYLLKTGDYGQTWRLVNGDLPADEFTRVVREDPARRGLLYAGTETGLYVSWDDGGRWRRMGGNLPVVPVYDLVVKDDDLVVATHGRSFWILDDLGALRQLDGDLGGAAPRLFRPGPAVRLRTVGGARGDAIMGMANYGHAATSVVAYLPEKRPDGTVAPRYLNAGANPPAGAIVRYYLPARPAVDLTLRVLDGAGNAIRTLTSADGDAPGPRLPATPGLHQVVWDLRHDGETRVADKGFSTWGRPAAPMVLPGTYTLELRAGDTTLTQPVEVVPDPRIPASRQDLAAQLDLLLQIRDRLSATNRAANTIRGLKGQVAGWEERCRDRADDERVAAVLAAARDLAAELAAIERELLDVRSTDPRLFPQGLHEKFNALFDAVDSADYRPTEPAFAVFAELSQRLDEQLFRLQNALAEEGNVLNRAIAAAGLPAVG